MIIVSLLLLIFTCFQFETKITKQKLFYKSMKNVQQKQRIILKNIKCTIKNANNSFAFKLDTEKKNISNTRSSIICKEKKVALITARRLNRDNEQLFMCIRMGLRFVCVSECVGKQA